MHNNSISKLLNFKDIRVNNIRHSDNEVKYAETQSIPEFKSCIKTYRNWY